MPNLLWECEESVQQIVSVYRVYRINKLQVLLLLNKCLCFYRSMMNSTIIFCRFPTLYYCKIYLLVSNHLARCKMMRLHTYIQEACSLHLIVNLSIVRNWANYSLRKVSECRFKCIVCHHTFSTTFIVIPQSTFHGMLINAPHVALPICFKCFDGDLFYRKKYMFS